MADVILAAAVTAGLGIATGINVLETAAGLLFAAAAAVTAGLGIATGINVLETAADLFFAAADWLKMRCRSRQ